MEKVLLLQILDSSWMEHLRAMDHLRSSVGLQGYAQIDPKVEYKREGMKIFAEMWTGVSDKVTDLVFRVEQFDPEFLSYLGARWQLDRAQTIHQSAPSELAPPRPPRSDIRAPAGGRDRREPAVERAEARAGPQPGKKVGRNDPCPCGSGKKFKACCMRKEASSRHLLNDPRRPSAETGRLAIGRPARRSPVSEGLRDRSQPSPRRLGVRAAAVGVVRSTRSAGRLDRSRRARRLHGRSASIGRRIVVAMRRSGKGFPDALRAQPDLPRPAARALARWLVYRALRSRGSTATAGRRSSWARPRCGSATGPASGSTP